MIESHPPIVIENSSFNIRAGIIGETALKCCFQTQVLRLYDSQQNKILIGSKIQENFDVPLLQISNQTVLSLYSLGKTICEEPHIVYQLSTLDLAGSTCINYMSQFLKDQLLKKCTLQQRKQITKDIKKSLCQVALNPILEDTNIKQMH